MTLPKNPVPDPHADPLVAAAVRAAAAGAAEGCPDAELLGLYAERALAGEARTHLEAHVQGCARCQAIVAAVVRALPDAPGTPVVADAVSTGGFAAWLGGWRWLVPATSLAAVALVAVWIGRGPADEAAESARTEERDFAPAASAPVVAVGDIESRDGRVRPPAVEAGTAAPETAPAAAAPARTAANDETRAPLSQGTGRRLRSVAPAPAEVGRSAEGPTGGARAKAEPAAEVSTGAAGLADDRAGRADTATATSPARATPPETRARNEAVELRESATATPAPPAAGAPSPAPSPADAASTFRSDVAVPSWRAVGGVVERSRDGGRTWQRVSTPGGARVVAVASVSVDVCWAITADAVFTVTDGATWTRTARPAAGALTSVSATSVRAATVGTASGSRFATTDGGATWVPVP